MVWFALYPHPALQRPSNTWTLQQQWGGLLIASIKFPVKPVTVQTQVFICLRKAKNSQPSFCQAMWFMSRNGPWATVYKGKAKQAPIQTKNKQPQGRRTGHTYLGLCWCLRARTIRSWEWGDAEAGHTNVKRRLRTLYTMQPGRRLSPHNHDPSFITNSARDSLPNRSPSELQRIMQLLLHHFSLLHTADPRHAAASILNCPAHSLCSGQFFPTWNGCAWDKGSFSLVYFPFSQVLRPTYPFRSIQGQPRVQHCPFPGTRSLLRTSQNCLPCSRTIFVGSRVWILTQLCPPFPFSRSSTYPVLQCTQSPPLLLWIQSCSPLPLH
nr:uncharacterized protein LOC112060595 [Chrysemys picta bellii]